MPETYDLHDGRFIQEFYANSAANALSVSSAKVPEGKVWTILRAMYYPSVAETQQVCWRIGSKPGTGFGVTRPETILLSQNFAYPLLTEGWEMKLWPGELIQAMRAACTAGSIMTIIYSYIETDLPYYSYVEPLAKIVKQTIRHGSVYRSTGGVSVPGVLSSSPRESGGGGKGEPQPV